METKAKTVLSLNHHLNYRQSRLENLKGRKAKDSNSKKTDQINFQHTDHNLFKSDFQKHRDSRHSSMINKRFQGEEKKRTRTIVIPVGDITRLDDEIDLSKSKTVKTTQDSHLESDIVVDDDEKINPIKVNYDLSIKYNSLSTLNPVSTLIPLSTMSPISSLTPPFNTDPFYCEN